MAEGVVDPFTGLPQESYAAQGVSGQIGMEAANAMGYQQGPLMGMLANIPNATTAMMWNARRGQNTILRGGFSRNAQNSGGILKNHLSPRSFGRLSSIHGVDPTNAPDVDRKGGAYSPFNFLAQYGNKAGNKALGNFGARMSAKIAEDTKLANELISAGGRGKEVGDLAFKTRRTRSGRAYGHLNNIGAYKDDATLFSPGVISRMGAVSKISKDAAKYEPNKKGRYRQVAGGKINSGQVMDNIARLDPNLGKAMKSHMGYITNPGASSLSHLTGASMKGVLSQQVTGYMTGAMVGAPSELTAKVLTAAGKTSYLSAAGKATEHLAAGGIQATAGRGGLRVASGEAGAKLGARLGLEVGEQIGLKGVGAAIKIGGAKTAAAMGARTALAAIPGVNVVMAAWMAYDLTKMGLSAMTGLADTGKDAVKSFKGSIDKGVMGMGYRDNSVAATSRARGVMAIQNSRLNARSVLGSEAGPLAAHFG